MADSTRVIDPDTLEQLTDRFTQLAIGNQAFNRRALMGTLKLPFDELCKQANTADLAAIQRFQLMFDYGVLHNQTLRDYQELHNLAIHRIANAFNQRG